jgi:1-acyl-sn-glycerol-3-phosphate acyltransferase
MLPVYRLSEGAENLDHNYSTFDNCKKIFARNGIVLIFSEGRCINEWHLRPLKKGTARLAIASWAEGIPLKILPLGYNYQSFTSFGKNVWLNFGEIITEKDIEVNNGYGKTITSFNERLNDSLRKLVVEIDITNKAAIKKTFEAKQTLLKKILLFLPAIAGMLAHFPLYYPVKKLTWKLAAHSGHFDSIMVSLLFILYPVYLVLISLLLFASLKTPLAFLALVILPFCAWSHVHLKKQF